MHAPCPAGGEFAAWFDRFLPGLAGGEPATLFTPAMVSDRGDGKIGHLDGLNLSRAWCWRQLADALTPDDPRRDRVLAAADAHLAASLPPSPATTWANTGSPASPSWRFREVAEKGKAKPGKYAPPYTEHHSASPRDTVDALTIGGCGGHSTIYAELASSPSHGGSGSGKPPTADSGFGALLIVAGARNRRSHKSTVFI